MLTDSQKATLDLIETDQNGKPFSTAQNILTILQTDPEFTGVRYNILRGWPEVIQDGKRRQWIDADDAQSRTYIEHIYRITSRAKFDDAFQIFLQNRKYHPVQSVLNGLIWDGQKHCETFFIKWAGVADSLYSREVSRLFFAGGVNRAFQPGCKFDAVAVLIGAQGAGKSTLCQWLAMDPDFYSSIKTISGQRGYEAIAGKWLIEIEELLAVLANERSGQRAEAEAKAFLSTQSDFYRKPYAHRPEDTPRNCVFIGTTNADQFLTDRTGNRRWFPLRCNQMAEFLYQNKDACQSEIRQCWAEMTAAFKAGYPLASPAPEQSLLSLIRAQQEQAEVEDVRAGIIEQYLQDKTRCCLIDVWRNAVYQGDYHPPQMTRKDSIDIAEILTCKLGWARAGTERFGEYGKQKAFHAPTDRKESHSGP